MLQGQQLLDVMETRAETVEVSLNGDRRDDVQLLRAEFAAIYLEGANAALNDEVERLRLKVEDAGTRKP